MASNKKQARPIFTTFNDISQPDLNGQVVGANEVSTNNIVTGQQPSVYKFTINGQDFDIASKDLNKYRTEIMNHIQNQSGVSNLGLSKLGKHVDDLFSALTQNVGDGRLNITLDPTGQIFTINGTDYGRVSNMERNYFGGLSARDLIGNFNKNFSSRLQGISPTGRTVTKTTSSFTPAALQKPASTTADEEGRFELLNSIAKRMNRDSWNDEVSKGWFGLGDDAKKRIIEDVLENDFKKHSSYAGWLKRNPSTSLTFTDFLNSKSALQSIEPIDYIKLYEQTAPTTDTNKAYTDFFTKNNISGEKIDADNYLKRIGIDSYIKNQNGTITAFKKNTDGSIEYYTLGEKPYHVFQNDYNNPHYGKFLFASEENPNQFILTQSGKDLTGADATKFRTYYNQVMQDELHNDLKGRDIISANGVLARPYLYGKQGVIDFSNAFDQEKLNGSKIFIYNTPKHGGGLDVTKEIPAIYGNGNSGVEGHLIYDPSSGWTFESNNKEYSTNLGFASTENLGVSDQFTVIPWFNNPRFAFSSNYSSNYSNESVINDIKGAIIRGDNTDAASYMKALKYSIINGRFSFDDYIRYKEVMDLIKQYSDSLQPKPQKQVTSQKYGGILKMQFGGLAEAYKDQTPDYYNDVTYAKADSKKFTTWLNERQWQDNLRTASLATDVASLAGGAVGGAAAAGSLLLNTIADIADDRVSREEAWKNFGINLGFTALALVPGLAALKITKGATKATKSAIKILSKADDAIRATDKSEDAIKAIETLKKTTSVKEAKETAKSLVELNEQLGGKLFGQQSNAVKEALFKLMESDDKVKRLGAVNTIITGGLSAAGVGAAVTSAAKVAGDIANGDFSNLGEDDIRNIIAGGLGVKGFKHILANRKAFNALKEKLPKQTEITTATNRKNKVTFKDVENVSIDVEGTPTSEKVKSAIDSKIANINQEISTKQAAGEDVAALQNQVTELTKAKDSFTEDSFKDKVKFNAISEKVNSAIDKGKGMFNGLKDWTSDTFTNEIEMPNLSQNELETKDYLKVVRKIFNKAFSTPNLNYGRYFKQGGKVKKYEQGDATTSGVNPEEQVKKEKGSSRTIEEKTLIDVLLENLEDQELIGFGNPRKLAFDIEPIGSIISHGIAALGNKKALKTLMDYEVPYVQAPEISLPIKVNTALENASKERARQLLNPHFHNLTSDASRNQAAYLDTQRQISENTRQVDAQIAQNLNQQRDKAVAQEYVNRKAQIEADNTNRAHAVAKANAKNQILAAYQKQQADNAEQLNRDIFSWAGRRIDQLNEANYLKGLHELAQKYQNPISDATAWANSAEVYESSNVAQSLATAGIDGDTPITADIIPENAKEQAVYPGGPKWKDVVGLTGKQLWLAEKNVAQRNLRNLMGQYSTDKVSLTADKTRYEHMISLPLYQKNGGSMTAQAQIYNTDRRMELAYKKLMADQEKYYNGLAYKKNRNSMAGLLRAFLQEDKHAFKK